MERKAIADIFQSIKAHKASALIVDIRGNGGGHSAMGDLIMSYLSDKKMRTYSKVQTKLSRRLLASDNANYVAYKKYSALEGMLITETVEEAQPQKPDALFKGRVFLLVDNGTFSSASDFAAMFRDYEVGEIIGYETGGLPTCFGNVFSMCLKNSGIDYGVSFNRFFGPRPKPGDDEHGILPQIPITEDILAQYNDQPDPVVAFAVDRIRALLKR